MAAKPAALMGVAICDQRYLTESKPGNKRYGMKIMVPINRITLSQFLADFLKKIIRSFSRSGLFFFSQAASVVEKEN